jgi:hypothetical protein
VAAARWGCSSAAESIYEIWRSYSLHTGSAGLPLRPGWRWLLCTSNTDVSGRLLEQRVQSRFRLPAVVDVRRQLREVVHVRCRLRPAQRDWYSAVRRQSARLGREGMCVASTSVAATSVGAAPVSESTCLCGALRSYAPLGQRSCRLARRTHPPGGAGGRTARNALLRASASSLNARGSGTVRQSSPARSLRERSIVRESSRSAAFVHEAGLEPPRLAAPEPKGGCKITKRALSAR